MLSTILFEQLESFVVNISSVSFVWMFKLFVFGKQEYINFESFIPETDSDWKWKIIEYFKIWTEHNNKIYPILTVSVLVN